MVRDKLQYACKNFKTPFYLFDMNEAEDRINYLRNSFGENIGICFAIKANPFLAGRMSELADRIEVCSMGEFEICSRLGIQPEKILISGVLKKEKDITKILEAYGSDCAYTVESLGQLISYANWSQTHKKKLDIYLRLTSGNQFGMDRQTIEDIIAARGCYQFLDIKGIHFFSGTQKQNAKKYKKEIAYLDEVFMAVEEKQGFKIQELEYGPGLAVAYFSDQKDTTDTDVEAIREALETMSWQGAVTIELGRAMAATCGYYMTAISDIKKNDQKNYCIVDGGIHQINYDGQIRGMYKPECMCSEERKDGSLGEWTICGSLCTANDVLIQKLELRDPKIGDVLIFEKAGAYAMTEGMALFLSHELPAVIAYSEDKGFEVVREEMETFNMNY